METTGLDPDRCDILEFAAIADDTSDLLPVAELPRLRVLFPRSHYTWEDSALGMHAGLRAEIAAIRGGGRPAPDTEVVREFGNIGLGRRLELWMGGFGWTDRVVLAGKNVANFDLRFLRKRSDWPDRNFLHRVIDPAMWSMRADDEAPPALAECLARAGLPDAVSHRAMDDAEQVVRLVRKGLGLPTD